MGERLQMQKLNFESTIEVTKKDNALQELEQSNYYAQQASDRQHITNLTDELVVQEKAHVADAEIVKEKIVALQDALLEKINTENQLLKATQKVKTKYKELHEGIILTEKEASQAQSVFEKRLDIENADIERLRALLTELFDKDAAAREKLIEQEEV